MNMVLGYPVLLVVSVVVLLAVAGVQDVEAQENITYTTYTDEDLSFEYPEGSIVEERTGRFDMGPDVSVWAPDSDINHQYMAITKMHEPMLTDLRTFAQMSLDSALDGFRSDIEYYASVIEGVSLDDLQIDNEIAATFLYATYERENDNPEAARNRVIVEHDNGIYSFVYESYAENFDSPENTAVREHFFNVNVSKISLVFPVSIHLSMNPLCIYIRHLFLD